MKSLYAWIAAILYILILLITFKSLPEELKFEQRKPYRIYQEERYYGHYQLPMIFIKEEDFYINYLISNGTEYFTFSFDEIEMITQNNNISLILDDIEIGTCDIYGDCVDLDLLDQYSLEDLVEFAEVSKLYEPEFPGIVNDINIRMFYFLLTLIYLLMCVLFYYGIYGHDQFDDFLRFTSKTFEKVHFLNDDQNAKWRVFAAHTVSIILASIILIYIIAIVIAIIMM